MSFLGHTIVRCEAPIVEDSGGWDTGATTGGGALGGWDAGGVGGEAAAATGSWADDAEASARWGYSGAGGW